MYTLPPLLYPLLEPVMSHCQIQLAFVVALFRIPPAIHCSPWFHLEDSNGHLGQAVLMPGSQPIGNRIGVLMILLLQRFCSFY